jgi:hypothetical protein
MSRWKAKINDKQLKIPFTWKKIDQFVECRIEIQKEAEEIISGPEPAWQIDCFPKICFK